MNVLSSIVCNSIITLDKPRQEHSNLAIIQRAKLKGAHKHSKSLLFVTQMQILTRMDKIVIKDYNHMTTMNGNVKLTYLLPKKIAKS